MAEAALRERSERLTEAYHDTHGVLNRLQENMPNRRQVLGFMTLLTFLTTLFVMGGFALAASTLLLVVSSPFLLLASPVLIPLGIFLFFVVSGFLGVGGFMTAAFSIASWLFKYIKGRHPPGAEQLDAARRSLAESIYRAKDLTQEHAGSAKARAQEAAPGA